MVLSTPFLNGHIGLYHRFHDGITNFMMVSLHTGYGKSTLYASFPYIFDKLRGKNLYLTSTSSVMYTYDLGIIYSLVPRFSRKGGDFDISRIKNARQFQTHSAP